MLFFYKNKLKLSNIFTFLLIVKVKRSDASVKPCNYSW